MENKLRSVNFKQFEDKFGNLIKEYEIIKYCKHSNGKWVEDMRFNSSRNYYIIDNNLYHRINDSLFLCNMDFNSCICGACYQIGKIIENNKKIIENKILFTEVCKLDNQLLMLSLYKQSYSDNTSFYSLRDKYNNSKLEYGSNNIEDLITQIEKEILLKEQYIKEQNETLTEHFKKIYNWKINIFNRLQDIKIKY
ncbi:hypothetical protein IC213_19010 [Clostridioides sp. ES-S-0049-02]|uniref:hypothetical protein n=1 Tax=Clostridioides sp. ES-S-0049-02 TaxID=2770778 RepID=UPI001D114E9B|nr:hypothetical protein [Clostridioides sp. ES-S-0049-02]